MNWLQSFFIFFPAYAWFFLGVGIPWALLLLPRDEWRSRMTVFTLGLALGPLLGTAWLFVLGTWGRLLPERALTGTALLAIVGFTGAWLRRHTDYRHNALRPEPWTGVEKTLVVMIALGMLVNIWISMFWPFVQYDTLWTFGYNARVFVLFQEIPTWIDYYPQLVPLTFTYGQLLNGGIDDHVARAAVPWFVFASVMMAYLLGWRVWGKRSIGILTAALWLLVPSALYWSGSGDLEHPIALYFTGAVVFFVMAWRSHHPRYAIISGLLCGGALWTKPTGGAFALGVMLVIALMLARLLTPASLRQRLGIPSRSADTPQVARQKLGVALVTGLASAPIGAMWYIRNLAYGHAAVIFPDDYWHDFAQRSGQELGWLILIMLLAAGLVGEQLWHQRGGGVRGAGRRLGGLLLGLGLFLVGTLPSALVLDRAWERDSLWKWAFGARPQDHGLSLPAIGLILLGLGLMLWAMFPSWQKTTERARSSTLLTGALIAPFAVVWFYNFSYHYRLMLTITPMLAAMAAALIDAWLIPFFSKNALRRRTAVFLAVSLCLPGLVIASWSTVWFTWFDPLHTDEEKYEAANPALMKAVEAVKQVQAERPGRKDVLGIYTLGEKRLNFFFPQMTTINDRDLITTIDVPMHSDIFIGGSTAEFLWREAGQYPNQLSAYMDLSFEYTRPFLKYQAGSIWHLVLTPIAAADDGTNRLVVYSYYYPQRELALDEINPTIRLEGDHWDFLALRGLDIRRAVPADSELITPDENGYLNLQAGEEIYLQLYWQRTAEATPPPRDYLIFVHLLDAETGEILSQRDGAIAQLDETDLDGLLPMTFIPYPDLIPDRRLWKLPDDLPQGEVTLYIGLYDPALPELPRLPLTGSDQVGADGITIEGRIRIVNSP